jgi:protein TonB
MVLSLALHGLVLLPLLVPAIAGPASSDEPALFVEIALAAPAPSASETGAAQAPPEAETHPATEPPIEPTQPTQDVAETKPPDQTEPKTPDPPPVVELPPPDEPPPLDVADLKPLEPPKSVEKPEPKPEPKVATKPPPAKPPAQPTRRAAAKAPARSQTQSPPNIGTDTATQLTASAPQPTIVWEGKPRFRVPPKPAAYPPRAIELGQQGEAIVRVRLDPDGSAAEILLTRGSGSDLLDRAALAAVRGWQFLPAMREGRAVAAWVEIPVRFHLR